MSKKKTKKKDKKQKSKARQNLFSPKRNRNCSNVDTDSESPSTDDEYDLDNDYYGNSTCERDISEESSTVVDEAEEDDIDSEVFGEVVADDIAPIEDVGNELADEDDPIVKYCRDICRIFKITSHTWYMDRLSLLVGFTRII